jgi:hypothetical protein
VLGSIASGAILGLLLVLAVFAGTAALWVFREQITGFEPLLVFIVLMHLDILDQFAPFLRLDGYYVVSDLTGVPDLFSHIGPTLRRLVPGRRKPSPLRPVARAIVTLWVVTVVPVLGWVLFMMVRVFPRLAATAWESMGARWRLLQDAWAGGSVGEVAVLGLEAPELLDAAQRQQHVAALHELDAHTGGAPAGYAEYDENDEDRLPGEARDRAAYPGLLSARRRHPDPPSTIWGL